MGRVLVTIRATLKPASYTAQTRDGFNVRYQTKRVIIQEPTGFRIDLSQFDLK